MVSFFTGEKGSTKPLGGWGLVTLISRCDIPASGLAAFSVVAGFVNYRVIGDGSCSSFGRECLRAPRSILFSSGTRGTLPAVSKSFPGVGAGKAFG